jgi:putative hydrolase of HD superfamily
MDSNNIPVASAAVNFDGNKGTSCDATTTTTRTDNTSTSTVTNTDHNAQQEHPLTMTNALTFLSTICGALKNIKRTGWVRMGVPLPESDADHMHRCAMCALMVTSQLPDPRDDYSGTNQIFHPSQINGSKLLKMALTHDLCESIAGDITPFCDAGAVASKYDKEKAAMEKIRDVVGDPLGTELFDLWKEYEEQRSPEALYCKDIDKFEMVLQASEYEKAHLISKNDISCVTSDETDSTSSSSSSRKKSVLTEPMRTFYITTSKKMKSPFFQRLDAELRMTRQEMLRQRGWEVLLEEK